MSTESLRFLMKNARESMNASIYALDEVIVMLDVYSKSNPDDRRFEDLFESARRAQTDMLELYRDLTYEKSKDSAIRCIELLNEMLPELHEALTTIDMDNYYENTD